MLMAMDIDKLIDQLAEEIGVPAATRKKWRQRGVPYRRRDDIRELAARRSVAIPREAFDNFGREAPAEAAAE